MIVTGVVIFGSILLSCVVVIGNHRLRADERELSSGIGSKRRSPRAWLPDKLGA
jgi:hypothetical protein